MFATSKLIHFWSGPQKLDRLTTLDWTLQTFRSDAQRTEARIFEQRVELAPVRIAGRPRGAAGSS